MVLGSAISCDLHLPGPKFNQLLIGFPFFSMQCENWEILKCHCTEDKTEAQPIYCTLALKYDPREPLDPPEKNHKSHSDGIAVTLLFHNIRIRCLYFQFIEMRKCHQSSTGLHIFSAGTYRISCKVNKPKQILILAFR